MKRYSEGGLDSRLRGNDKGCITIVDVENPTFFIDSAKNKKRYEK